MQECPLGLSFAKCQFSALRMARKVSSSRKTLQGRSFVMYQCVLYLLAPMPLAVELVLTGLICFCVV